jgi:PAS domain S-box-containing protein
MAMTPRPVPPFGESYYRALFSAAADAFFVCDRSGRLIDCNEEAPILLGSTREQLLGTTPSDWWPDTQADGRDSREVAAGILKRALGGETVHCEWTNLRADATLVTVSASVRQIVVDDTGFILIVGRDISERKRAERRLSESEERFRAFFEQAPLALPIAGHGRPDP